MTEPEAAPDDRTEVEVLIDPNLPISMLLSPEHLAAVPPEMLWENPTPQGDE